MERVAIIGAGLMGHGLAQSFAAAGHAVALHDSDRATLAQAPDRVRGNLAMLGWEDDGLVQRISLHKDLASAVGDADLVVEAGPERLEIKRSIFAAAQAAAPAEAILATNTSVISIADIAAGAADRRRVVGTHWWNPPYLVPLVEVVPGPDTDADVVAQTVGILTRAGKTPVALNRDVPGFIGNRLQHALWREAFALVDAGVCDADTIDLVVKSSFGRRLAVLGPMENADLIGLDLTLDIHRYLLPRLDPPSPPSGGLVERVARDELGMRTGSGFREWGAGDAVHVREGMLHHLAQALERDEERSP